MYFIHISVYMSISISQFIPPPPTPAFPPWCPYICSLHLCLFLPCKLVHLYHFPRFHIYALIDDICFSLSNLLHSVWVSRSTHVSTKWPNFIPFYGWVIFHCICVPHLYPFICWWAFRLLPWPDYYKYCCSEHWGACVFLNYSFLWVYAQ